VTEDERHALLVRADEQAFVLCRAYAMLGIPAVVVRHAEGEVGALGAIDRHSPALCRAGAVVCKRFLAIPRH
jgi:hypothetical protein